MKLVNPPYRPAIYIYAALFIPTAIYRALANLANYTPFWAVEESATSSRARFSKRATDLRLVGLVCEISKLLVASTKTSPICTSKHCRNLPGNAELRPPQAPSKATIFQTDIGPCPYSGFHLVEGNRHG